MKIAIEIVSIIIAITIGCVVVVSLITTSNQNAAARDFYNVVVNRIEDSNCNSMVISECINEAINNGYELNIEDVTVYEDEPSRLVVLKYNVELPIFQIFGHDYVKGVVIQGYAR